MQPSCSFVFLFWRCHWFSVLLSRAFHLALQLLLWMVFLVFPQMSNLVASQIMNYADVSSRANSIEKWVAVADICRCMHNYNGVLEITSALNRSAIYRLKKTWAKVSKQVRRMLLHLKFLDFSHWYVVQRTMCCRSPLIDISALTVLMTFLLEAWSCAGMSCQGVLYLVHLLFGVIN